jgi:hypothetical protein
MAYLQELSDAGDIDPDTLVYAAVQPAYPYAFPLVDCVADPPLPEEDWPGAVYLAVGRCAGRLDPEIRRELGWAAEPPRESDPDTVPALPASEPAPSRSNRKRA